jgi:hypothetical protein
MSFFYLSPPLLLAAMMGIFTRKKLGLLYLSFTYFTEPSRVPVDPG